MFVPCPFRVFAVSVSLLLWSQMGVEGATQAQLYTLMESLFSHGKYVPEVRPTVLGEGTNVSVQLHLLAVQTLDEKMQVLESALMLRVEWRDHYLKWSLYKNGDIKYIMYPQSKLWLPDLVLANSVESQTQLGFDQHQVKIYNKGGVVWTPSQVFRTACNIDITYYPFDTQTCEIIVSSLVSDKFDITLNQDPTESGLNLKRYNPSGTWALESSQVQYLVNEEGRTELVYSIKLRRLKTYYVLNMLLPVLFLSFTASMVFYLPAEAGEKIGMSITVLLAFAVYLSILSESLPHTSLQVSVLSVYLTCLLGVTALGVVASVAVLHLHHQPQERRVGARVAALTLKLRCLLRLQGTPQRCADPGLSLRCADIDINADLILKPVENKAKQPKFLTKNVVHPTATQKVFMSPEQIYKNKERSVDAIEEISWLKVAETTDRVLFLLTSLSIAAATSVFFCCLFLGGD